jgi:hypothetical protein
VTIVASPPGGGKTHLAATVVAHLATGGVSVAVATPTRAQALGFASRLSAQLDPTLVYCDMTRVGPRSLPAGVRFRGDGLPGTASVFVRTVAGTGTSPPEVDVLVVDEAYQTTFADAAKAADKAEQVLLVGDPGQIGPVVTVRTDLWDHLPAAPHRRAPESFAHFATGELLTIPVSRRLGPDTVAVIAPLQDFGFTTERPERSALRPDGVQLAEIETLRVAPAANCDDLGMLREVTDRAFGLVGVELSGPGSAPDRSPLRLTWDAEGGDVAVVVARNSQVAIVSGMLREAGAPAGLVVGTADKLQGGEWPLVVALDPAAGNLDANDHAISPGRLTVMLSRHTTHLTWVTDGSVPERAASATRQLRQRRRW